MVKAVQSRTLKTRAKLITAAQAVIDENGYQAMRVEEVVLRAGVAKGTFFAHFPDKEDLMDQLIGARINAILDDIADTPTPQTIDEMATSLMPLVSFMACERYVFDIIFRHSGAAAIDTIGVIAMTFEHQARIVTGWLSDHPFRRDVSPDLLAEGVQAFLMQAIALNFCALHCECAMQDRIIQYLQAWLSPDIRA